jgi:hypothetical protein
VPVAAVLRLTVNSAILAMLLLDGKGFRTKSASKIADSVAGLVCLG